jgi:CBS domain-containing protein
MYSQRIRSVMAQEKLLTAQPQTTVIEAARLMVKQQVGAVVVTEGGVVSGIFTERDAVYRVMAQDRDPRTTTLAEVMTSPAVTALPDKDFGFALQLMHQHGFRHVPVVESDGRLVGIVSSRDALDPEMEEFVCEASRRVAIR